MAKETLGQLINRKRPDIEERIRVRGLWDYRILAPMSLDDMNITTVQFQFGKERNESQVTVEVYGEEVTLL